MTEKRDFPLIEAVDLFCGAGGLTCGLNASKKVRVRCGIDNDPQCEYPYTYNNQCKFVLQKIENVTPQDVASHFSPKSIRLLAGCAPCQTFSRYNPRADEKDVRWWLILEFMRLIRAIRPELVTMENVPGLTKQKIFHDFVQSLQQAGYAVEYQVVDCSRYGLPQCRHRLVVLASRYGKVSLLSPDEAGAKPQTVRDAIGRLPELEAGETWKDDPLHCTRNLSKINLERIRNSVAGGTWRSWPKELIVKCHMNDSGKHYGSVYGRMEWDKPSPTITTQFFGYGNGRFGHPEQDRAISLREGAIFQGFPKDYVFTKPDTPISGTTVGRLIGNAVPVKLGEIIGLSLANHVKQYLR